MRKFLRRKSPNCYGVFMTSLCFQVLLVFGWVALCSVSALAAEPRIKIVVSVAGWHDLVYLPVHLMAAIGADHAEGADVVVVGGNGATESLRQMTKRNSDFAAVGMPSAISARLEGAKIVTIAAISDQPHYALMVRSDLRDRVHSVADLRGSVIATTGGSLGSATLNQQLVRVILESNGVPTDTTRHTTIGQNWDEQSAAISSGKIDALMSHEPFVSRLLHAGKAFVLVDSSKPETIRSIPWTRFLQASLQARTETIENNPDKAATMVRILRRTLRWIAAHTPEEIVAALSLPDDEERRFLLMTIKKYNNLYSLDGAFSQQQLAETEHFFKVASGNDAKVASGNDAKVANFQIKSIVNDEWAGSHP